MVKASLLLPTKNVQLRYKHKGRVSLNKNYGFVSPMLNLPHEKFDLRVEKVKAAQGGEGL